MPSRESAAQFANFDARATGHGPVPSGATNVPQGLLDMHRNIAARVTYKPAETAARHDDPREDRVRNTGARTPESLAVQTQAQVDRNEWMKKGSAGGKAGS